MCVQYASLLCGIFLQCNLTSVCVSLTTSSALLINLLTSFHMAPVNTHTVARVKLKDEKLDEEHTQINWFYFQTEEHCCHMKPDISLNVTCSFLIWMDLVS